jgi:hypothetical protein
MPGPGTKPQEDFHVFYLPQVSPKWNYTKADFYFSSDFKLIFYVNLQGKINISR